MRHFSSNIYSYVWQSGKVIDTISQGLRTLNEGKNQKNLKIWADVADKLCLAVPKNLGVGVDFRPCSEGDFLTGRP